MARWADVEAAEPDFADRVRALFDAGRHKTIATLRADGAPRISGIECEFVDGEVTFGTMLGARKLADIERDPRIALHGPTSHPAVGQESTWSGEAKLAGRAVPSGLLMAEPEESDEGADAEPHGAGFTVDLTEVVVTGLNDGATMLVVEWWTPGRGLQRAERA